MSNGRGSPVSDQTAAMISRLGASERAPYVGLAILTVFAALVFGRLAWDVPGPEVFGDELYYMEGATALAGGDGLKIRDGPYRYPPGYPVVLAVVLATVDDRSLAYQVALVLSAVVAATIAVPTFLLARRVTPDWHALAAAAVTLLLPVSFYAAYVMSDAIGLVAAAWALLALQLAVERPTVSRQLAVIGAVGVATAFRAQYAVLLIVLPIALGVRVLVERRRPTIGRSLRRLWPILSVFVVGALAVVARAAATGSVASVVGSYAPLWRSYSPVAVIDWTGRQTLALGMFFLFVPVLLLPGIAASLARSARRGDSAGGAFLGVWLTTTAVGILLVGAFSATPFGLGRLHDRYLTFVFPLWIVGVFAWITRGAPVLRKATLGLAGAFAALALVGHLDRMVAFRGRLMFDGVSIVPWAVAVEGAGLSGQQVTVAVLVGLGIATSVAIATPLSRAIGLAVVVVVLTLSGYGMWARAAAVGGRDVLVHPRAAAERLWVDRTAGDEPVLALFVRTGTCTPEAVRSAMLITEFFNDTIGPVVHLSQPLVDRTSESLGRVVRGTLVDERGDPVRARLVVTSSGVELLGRRLTTGTSSNLALWRVDGRVQVLRLPVRERVCERRDSSDVAG